MTKTEPAIITHRLTWMSAMLVNNNDYEDIRYLVCRCGVEVLGKDQAEALKRMDDHTEEVK